MLEKHLVVNICLINFEELQLQVEYLEELVILNVRSGFICSLEKTNFANNAFAELSHLFVNYFRRWSVTKKVYSSTAFM